MFMRGYIPTQSRLKKREPLIAMGSHQGWVCGSLNFCVLSTPLDEMKDGSHVTQTSRLRLRFRSGGGGGGNMDR